MIDHAKVLFDFLIFTVIVKMIIGHWIASRLVDAAKAWFGSNDRKQAIWLHYQAKAAGKGHNNTNVLTCGQEHCQIFSQPVRLADSASTPARSYATVF